MRTAAALGLCLWCTGCVVQQQQTLKLRWSTDFELRHAREAFPDDPAAILERNDHVVMGLSDDFKPYSQYGRHEVIALHSEAGFGLAEVKIPFRASDTFLELKARVWRPSDRQWEGLDASGYVSDVDDAGEHDLNARFFRFPGIEVGALLEYYYVIQTPRIFWYAEHESVGQFPVHHYSLRVEAPKSMVLAGNSYNSKETLSIKDTDEDSHVLAVDFHDIPHRPPEDFAPHWTFTEPRWTWRITDIVLGRARVPGLRSWADLLESGGDIAGASPALYQGYRAELDLGGCDEVRCKVDQVLAFVSTHARNKGGEPLSSARPLRTVLETNSASGLERAILVRQMLEDVGVEARLALAARHWSAQVDARVPSYSQFNQMLVYLPPQETLGNEAWLMPRCDYCRLNELPQELRGVEALVFAPRDTASGNLAIDARWKSTTSAEPALATRTLLHHQARLDGEGRLIDTFRSTLEGAAAERGQLKAAFETREDLVLEQSAEVVERAALGELLEVLPTQCQSRKGRCERSATFAIPVYATRENAQRWLVPLNALSDALESTLAATQLQRRSDVYFEHESQTEEVFDLEVPAGFVLENPPGPQRVVGPFVEAEVKVEATALGARVTRILRQSIGGVSVMRYDEVRKPFRAFQEARGLVLSFVKKEGS